MQRSPVVDQLTWCSRAEPAYSVGRLTRQRYSQERDGNLFDELQNRCETAPPEELLELLELAGVAPADLRADAHHALWLASRGNNLPLVSYLLEEVSAGAPAEVYAECLEVAAELGHVVVVHRLLRLLSVEALRANPRAFWLACRMGQLECAQAVAAAGHYTREDITARQGHAFCFAAEGGHVAVAQWLADAFDLDRAAVTERCGFPLRAAAYHGHAAFAQWLVERFDLTMSDLMVWDGYARRVARRRGYVELADWLDVLTGYAVPAGVAKELGDLLAECGI